MYNTNKNGTIQIVNNTCTVHRKIIQMKFYTIEREKHSIQVKNRQCFKITFCKYYKEGEERDEIKTRIMERDISQDMRLYILYKSLFQIECTFNI